MSTGKSEVLLGYNMETVIKDTMKAILDYDFE